MERPAATCADPPREKGRTKKERSPRRNSKCFRTKVHRSPRETKDRRPETTRSDTKDRSHRGRASFRGRSIALEAQTGSRTPPFRSVLDPKTSPKTLRRAPGALPGAPGSPGAPPGAPTSSKVDACAGFRASGGHLGTLVPASPRPPPPPPYTLQQTQSTSIHSHKRTDPHAAPGGRRIRLACGHCRRPLKSNRERCVGPACETST